MRRFVVLFAGGMLVLGLTAGQVQAGIGPLKQVDLKTVAQLVGGNSAQPSAENPSQGQPSKNVGRDQKSLAWSRRDTAVYVVSTLNLLRTRPGRALPTILRRQGIASYDVYADSSREGLYFVELVTSSGDVAGALAYQMGWLKPESISSLTDRLSIRAAPDDVARAYKSDSKLLIGSFTSTLPS